MLSVVHEEGEGTRVCICVHDRNISYKHGSAECGLVSLFGLRRFWFVFSLESVYFLL